MLRSRHTKHPTSTHPDIKLPQMCESSFIKNPQQQKVKIHSLCQCTLCSRNIIHNQYSVTQCITSNSVLISSEDKSNLQVLLSSITGKNKKKGLNIDIPQTCFYKSGKPETMYYNSHQQVKALNTKRFSNRQVLKEFLRRRKEAKQNFQNLIQMSSRQLNEVHEKYFQKLKPSYKQKVKEEQLHQKIFKVHRDSQFQILQDKQQTRQQACIAHFTDGTSILINQGQFKSIKNNYPHFSNAEYVQALIPCVQTVTSEFDQYSCINHKQLYNKARIEVQILLGQINATNSKDSGVDEIQQLYNILKITPSSFALYETFKIIHYIFKTTETIIYSLKLNWAITKQKHYFLLNVINMNYRKRDAKQIKKLLANQLEILRNNNTVQAQQIDNMQQIMISRWKSLKKQKNIHSEQQIIIKTQAKPISRNSFLFKSQVSMKESKVIPPIFRHQSLCQSQFI